MDTGDGIPNSFQDRNGTQNDQSERSNRQAVFENNNSVAEYSFMTYFTRQK